MEQVLFMRLYVFALFLSLSIAARSGSAQVIRINSFKPRPQLTLGDTLTVSASPSVVNITLVPKGTAVASSSVTINTDVYGAVAVLLVGALCLFCFGQHGVVRWQSCVLHPLVRRLRAVSHRNANHLYQLHEHGTVRRGSRGSAGLLKQ